MAPTARGVGDEPDPCATALAGDLGWGLGMVFRAYATATRQALTDLPGGPRGYQVLAAACRDAFTSQLQLAQHLGVDRTVMTYLLDDLERAGLIERRADPADRRVRRIVATEAGAALLEVLDRRLEMVEAHVLAPLGDAGAQQFRAQLQALATQANALDPVDNPCQLADELDSPIASPRR